MTDDGSSDAQCYWKLEIFIVWKRIAVDVETNIEKRANIIVMSCFEKTSYGNYNRRDTRLTVYDDSYVVISFICFVVRDLSFFQ